jgi:hypothetical protein
MTSGAMTSAALTASLMTAAATAATAVPASVLNETPTEARTYAYPPGCVTDRIFVASNRILLRFSIFEKASDKP